MDLKDMCTNSGYCNRRRIYIKDPNVWCVKYNLFYKNGV